MTDKAPAALGGTAIKPVGWDRTGWEAFRYMLWNPDTGEVLTRTPLSWFKITVFYCIYYSCLAGFWIACLNIFFLTLPEETSGPRWTQTESLIGVNPGVGLRPRNNDARIDSQMFVLKQGDTNTWPSEEDGEGDVNADYAERMKKFLKVYDETSMGKKPDGTKYPIFDVEAKLGKQCGVAPYGYVAFDGNATVPAVKVAPCIFVKLNAIWGWTPEPYECLPPGESGDVDCPASLRNHLASEDAIKAGPDNVWIDCKGRYAADQEALEGRMEYFPKGRNIPIDYFPYNGKKKEMVNGKEKITEAYHSPLVAIKVDPKNEGQMVHIECRAYYKGVRHVTKTKEGLVQFEVQIKKE